MAELVYVLNGSNLNMLGKREPELYGKVTLAEVEGRVMALAPKLNLHCVFRQTNHEGVLIDWLHEAFEQEAAVILNPAGFSFGSVPVLDAVKLIKKPFIELHITNIHQRDDPYRHSLISTAAAAVICGLGVDGYLVALHAIALATQKAEPSMLA
jgi:3-dehydroquinate dehydratase-2